MRLQEKFQREYKRVALRLCRKTSAELQETDVVLDSLGNNDPHDNPNSCRFYIASELGKDDD